MDIKITMKHLFVLQNASIRNISARIQRLSNTESCIDKVTKTKSTFRAITYLLCFFPVPISVFAADITGKWCLNGEPYTCYPPIEHHGEAHACIESTAIKNANGQKFDWVIQQTMHYYTSGLANGGHKPMQVTYTFERTDNPSAKEFKHVEQTDEATRVRSIVVKNTELEMTFKQVPHSNKHTKQNQLLSYKRCSSDTNEHSFYTALVDCGGTGDYIAGVPAVIDNALLWDLGKSKSGSSCRVAAKCWGGGWAAVAYSKGKSNSNGKAFGAACGGESRKTVIEQAIRSCQNSGGNNCFATVVSGHDSGISYNTNTDKKGNKVQLCSNGDCKKQ